MKLLARGGAVLALIIALPGHAQKLAPPKTPTASVTWMLSSMENNTAHPTVIGKPQVIKTPYGPAVLFDGKNDALVVNTNPLTGAEAFTVEAVFRPDAGGSAEQRWLHIQEATGDNRVLLETRVAGDQWFLDTFIKGGENSRALYAENFKHRVGQWYHVALVFDGETMRHYVNGAEELSAPLTIRPLVGGLTAIGVRMNRVYWFKGAIRKARFTKRALAPGEFMDRK